MSNRGCYYCQVQNLYGKVDSNPAMVTVEDHYSSLMKSTILHSSKGCAMSQTQDFTSQES